MELRFHPGEIVYANAGKDKGKYFIVLSLDNEFLYLCNGKSRKLNNLKKKKMKHVKSLNVVDETVADRISTGKELTDKQIRKVISELKEQLKANI